jgi:hypothetical protein
MVWFRNSLLLIAGLVVILFCLGANYYCKGWLHSPESRLYRIDAGSLHGSLGRRGSGAGSDNAEAGRLSEKLKELKAFAVAHGYNSRIAFLADMQLASGKNRLFVCDISGDSILQAGLVAHGSGNKAFSFSPVFSNTDGSGCSSLGRYRIGRSYIGRFGLAYTLYGLDKTNDQAIRRHVVLHAYSCIPETETEPYPICNSLGCAMVSPGFLRRLQPVIDGSHQPILLWIFD